MEKLISTTELASILGISRISVFRNIKNGTIQAQKLGRNYLISKKEVDRLLGKRLSSTDKIMMKRIVSRVVREYGKTLKKLGEE